MTHNKPTRLLNSNDIKGSSNTQHHEETFLNAFIVIAKKGMADWERSKASKEKDG